jgi:hypothetical protein
MFEGHFVQAEKKGCTVSLGKLPFKPMVGPSDFFETGSVVRSRRRVIEHTIRIASTRRNKT